MPKSTKAYNISKDDVDTWWDDIKAMAWILCVIWFSQCDGSQNRFRSMLQTKNPQHTKTRSILLSCVYFDFFFTLKKKSFIGFLRSHMSKGEEKAERMSCMWNFYGLRQRKRRMSSREQHKIIYEWDNGIFLLIFLLCCLFDIWLSFFFGCWEPGRRASWATREFGTLAPQWERANWVLFYLLINDSFFVPCSIYSKGLMGLQQEREASCRRRCKLPPLAVWQLRVSLLQVYFFV